MFLLLRKVPTTKIQNKLPPTQKTNSHYWTKHSANIPAARASSGNIPKRVPWNPNKSKQIYPRVGNPIPSITNPVYLPWNRIGTEKNPNQ